MKPRPTILCDGHIRYESLECGCRLKEVRTRCHRVVQQGEPGGDEIRAGMCWLCEVERRMERQQWDGQMYRHAHHRSSLKPLADPFAAVRYDAE